MSLTILLAHGHTILREGLRALLDAQPKMKVVAQATDGESAVTLCSQRRPHVAVLDLGLPGLDGVGAARRIKAECPSVRILMISNNDDGRSAGESLRAGACGFISTDSASEELVRAIHAVLANRTYLSPHVADMVMDRYVREVPGNGGNGGDGGRTVNAVLTNRQQQILQMLADGQSTKQIARSLGISPKTVDSHRKDLMAKLNLDGIAKLTKYAVREGISSLDT